MNLTDVKHTHAVVFNKVPGFAESFEEACEMAHKHAHDQSLKTGDQLLIMLISNVVRIRACVEDHT